MRSNKLYTFFLLHGLLLLYSFCAVLSKLAATETFLSIRFILFYGASVFLLAIYAVGWQQVLKSIPLSVAYANKAVTTVWGMLWGLLLFREEITVYKLVGAGIICCGIWLVVSDDR